MLFKMASEGQSMFSLGGFIADRTTARRLHGHLPPPFA